jgi:hypothetical protein
MDEPAPEEKRAPRTSLTARFQGSQTGVGFEGSGADHSVTDRAGELAKSSLCGSAAAARIHVRPRALQLGTLDGHLGPQSQTVGRDTGCGVGHVHGHVIQDTSGTVQGNPRAIHWSR